MLNAILIAHQLMGGYLVRKQLYVLCQARKTGSGSTQRSLSLTWRIVLVLVPDCSYMDNPGQFVPIIVQIKTVKLLYLLQVRLRIKGRKDAPYISALKISGSISGNAF